MFVQGELQAQWDALTENKLNRILPDMSEAIPRCRPSRREEVVLCRLHIGHTYYTHSHLLKGEERPFCFACDEPDTIEHILISCTDLIEVRTKYYTAESMKVLFRDVPPDRILAFLKEINMYCKI